MKNLLDSFYVFCAGLIITFFGLYMMMPGANDLPEHAVQPSAVLLFFLGIANGVGVGMIPAIKNKWGTLATSAMLGAMLMLALVMIAFLLTQGTGWVLMYLIEVIIGTILGYLFHTVLRENDIYA